MTMKKNLQRRRFLQFTALSAAGLGLSTFSEPFFLVREKIIEGRIGIIGLDTSHSVAFTKALNAVDAPAKYKGFRVVAAYPKGSNDIESSVSRIPGYTEQVKNLGVEIVDSIEALLKRVDFILLETNDGRLHLKQALEVMKAGKPLFIDKPVAASLTDAIAIYDAAKAYRVPLFSCSSLRYMESAQAAAGGKIGKVLGADAYSPSNLEKTHPDLFWYGIHGVETLLTVMGTGCSSVTRFHQDLTDLVVGNWQDGRIGTFRGTRNGKSDYGGTVYGEKGNMELGPFNGYDNLLDRIIEFFKTGIAPVSDKETLEIFTFMEAADESKRRGGKPVALEEVYSIHLKRYNKIKHTLKLPQ